MKSVKRSGETKRQTGSAGQVRLRRKINPASPPTSLELGGIPVHFPFRPYKCQETYMEKVITALQRSENALLESPTGTGKTLCLLCSTMAWQQEQARLMHQSATVKEYSAGAGAITGSASQDTTSSKRLPTIIYASRTHSQLSQVVRELRNTRYRPHHAVLGSREQMCVNQKVKKPHSTASDINHDCNKLGKERKCRFRNNLEGFTAPPNESGGGGSQFQPVLDMEELLSMGTTMNVCPFYYTRARVEHAELILVPYNYLFDKDARETTLADVPWNNAVVIFDEAHNLESFASDSASFDLSNTDVAGCVAEIQKSINYLEAMPDLHSNLKQENLLRLKTIFLRLESYIVELDSSTTAYSGEFMMHILQTGAGINHGNHELLIEEVRKVNDLIMDMKGSGSTRGSARLEHFVQCLKRVFGHKLESRCLAKASFYRVHVSPKQQGNQPTNRTISYWCFAPALAMEELSDLKVRSILVTSGTLSPLPSYSMELGLEFPHTLENPHIIKSDQVHVRVVGKGVSGKELNSSYERRKDNEYYIELGNTLVSLSRVIPAGMLIFFPSYGVMETCLEKWGGPSNSRTGDANNRNKFFAQRKKKKATSNQYVFPQIPSSFHSSAATSAPWKRLLGFKSVVLEPRTSADLPDAISEFKRLLGLPKSPGCILMGVCRGKISEGIDFSQDMSRAVVITGLPFAPSHDPKVKLKREYLDASKASQSLKANSAGGFGQTANTAATRLSGHEWYTQQAHRAVNQAVGRVIRSKTDYGAVLLLDSRFGQPRNQDGLSKWVRPFVRNDEGFGAAIKSLAAFYREMNDRAFEKVEDLPQTKSQEGATQSESNEVSQVAFIRPGAIADANSSASSQPEQIETYVPPERVMRTLDIKNVNDNMIADLNNQKKGQPPSFDAAFAGSRKKNIPESKSVAACFLDATRTLSMAAQSKVRKSVVALKKYSDKGDLRVYRKTAYDIIRLLLSEERVETPPREGDSRLLFLFLKLLPQAHRHAIENLALGHVFDNSNLGAMCREKLEPADLDALRSAFVLVVHDGWFGAAAERATQFLKNLEGFLGFIFRMDPASSKPILATFLPYIPDRMREKSISLVDEFAAKRKIDEMKVKEESKTGQAAIDSKRFAPAIKVEPGTSENASRKGYLGASETHSKKHELVQSVEAIDNHTMFEIGKDGCTIDPTRKRIATEVMNESETQGLRGLRHNPYKRQAANRDDRTRDSTLKPVLKDVLDTVSSDPFVKPKNKQILRSIGSTSLSKRTCQICHKPLQELYISECGHLACLNCWKDWLRKSDTCFHCRKPASVKKLALAVFQKPDPS